MRDLSSSDLQLVSGGFDTRGATLRALGTINSTLGYVTAIRTLQQWGSLGRETTMGAASAAAIAKWATHSMWDRPGNNPADSTGAAMSGCFILGAGVGLAEGIIKTAAAGFIKA